jgi:glucose-6-phosphate isomerase
VKDQHAILQLFLDGPDDKFYIFVKPEKSHHDVRIPGSRFSLQKLFDAEYLGVKSAFEKKKKPFLEISFPSISESTLGEFFFFFELEVAFLGSLFKVNYENQPAVELSKRITRSLLAAA